MKRLKQITYLTLLLSVLMMVGCDTVETEPEPEDQDELVGGVNLTQLFAEPTGAEIAAVRTEWAGRTYPATGYQVEFDSTITDSAGWQYQVISHMVNGSRHYAGVSYPENDNTGSLPVIIYTHGGDTGIDYDGYLGVVENQSFDHIAVFPSYRGEEFRTLSTAGNFMSEGELNLWDTDVDDVISLLNVVLAEYPEADASKIGVVGFSRGGAVGMLVSEREPRVKVLVEYFGPTSFFLTSSVNFSRSALNGDILAVTEAQYLFNTFLFPHQDGEITQDQARGELLKRSPLYFIDTLPPMMIHHGTLDFVVLIENATAMDAAMTEAGNTAPDYIYHNYPGGGHSLTSLPDHGSRSDDFLKEHLGIGSTLAN